MTERTRTGTRHAEGVEAAGGAKDAKDAKGAEGAGGPRGRLLAAVPVRTLLIGLFGSLLVATVGLTAWLLIRSGDRIVQNVIALAADGVHDGIERQTRHFLGVADRANQELALSWASGRIDLADDAATSRLMRDLVEVTPPGALSSVGLGFPDGRFVGLIADPTRWPDADWRYSLANPGTEGRLVYYADAMDRTVGRELSSAGAFDPRTRPWYRAALASTGSVWTDVYANFGDGTPTVSRAVAIRDDAGTVVAVALTDLFVRHVQGFLETLPMSVNSEVFVTLPDRRVLAAWSPSAAVDAFAARYEPAPGVYGPELAAAMPTALLRLGETAAAAEPPDAVRGDTIEALAQELDPGLLGARIRPEAARTMNEPVTIDDDHGFLLATRLDDELMPDWTLGAFVPERDYLESVPEIARRVVPLALLVLLTALATVAGFSTLVSRPLVRLGESARRIADGRFDEPVVVDANNEVGRLSGAIDDMRRRLGRAFATLDAERERSAATLDAIGDAVVMTRDDGTVALMNRAAERLVGASDRDASGRPIHEVVRARDASRDRPLTRKVVLGVIAESRTLGTALTLRDAAGALRPVHCTVTPLGAPDRPRGAVLVLSDLSEAERHASELAWHAAHDFLTGLPNRAEFERRAQRALAAGTGALAWLELEGFRAISDAVGHEGGDELLRQVAATLESSTDDDVTVARFGGDEFALLFERREPDAVMVRVGRARDAVADMVYTRDGARYGVGASFGVAPLDADTLDVPAALRAAQAACRDAKAAGLNRVRLHAEGAAGAADARAEREWLERLGEAIEDGRLEPYAQRVLPVALAGEQAGLSCAGSDVEVLVRLRERDGSLLLPDDFLPAAERYGIAPRVDRAVADCCLLTLANHPALLGAVGTVWLNLSALTLGDERFVGWVEAALARHGIDPSRIGFEITETAAIGRLSDALRVMQALRDVGCRFALDDFGAGASSFDQLRALPLDVLKIDGQFIRSMHGDARNRALVASIHSLAWSFGLETVAEYVETMEDLEELRAIGVDRVQGHLMDRPRPLLELLQDSWGSEREAG